MSAEVTMYMAVKQPAILNNVRMRLLIRDIIVNGDLRAGLNETSLNAFPLGQLFEWQCWLSILENPDLENLGIRFGSVSFEADCESPYSCSSPGLKKLAENLKSPRAAAHLGELATRFMSLLLERLRPRLDASLESATLSLSLSPSFFLPKQTNVCFCLSFSLAFRSFHLNIRLNCLFYLLSVSYHSTAGFPEKSPPNRGPVS